MKTLNKIIVCLIFIFSININATSIKITQTEKEDLITLMSNDINVDYFLKNAFAAKMYSTLINNVESDASKNEKLINKITKCNLTASESMTKIYATFPELNSISIIDRENIFLRVFNNQRFIDRTRRFFGCTSGMFITFGTCLNIGNTWRKFALEGCFAVGYTATLAALAAEPIALVTFLASPSAGLTAISELEGCAAITTVASIAETSICIGFAIETMGACIDEYFGT